MYMYTAMGGKILTIPQKLQHVLLRWHQVTQFSGLSQPTESKPERTKCYISTEIHVPSVWCPKKQNWTCTGNQGCHKDFKLLVKYSQQVGNQITTMKDKGTWGCVKTPFKVIVMYMQDPAPYNNILDHLWGHPVISPTPPSNVVAKKSTHFHPFCSQFNFVWGGRGGVTSFSNITLTSIVGSVTLFMKVAGVTRGNSLPLALNYSSASRHKRHCIKGTKHS